MGVGLSWQLSDATYDSGGGKTSSRTGCPEKRVGDKLPRSSDSSGVGGIEELCMRDWRRRTKRVCA